MDLTEIQNGVGSIGELMNDCGVSASRQIIAGFAAGGIQKPGMSMEDKKCRRAISRLQETLSNLLDDKPAIEQHNTFTITGNDPKELLLRTKCLVSFKNK